MLVDAVVTLACIGPGKKPRRLPKELADALSSTDGSSLQMTGDRHSG
jgi:hypothetical protein